MTSVLVVDDEASVATTIKAILERDGHEVVAVTRGNDAIRLLQDREFDVVLTDLRLEDIDGLEILREVQRRWPDTASIMLTGYASLESAIAALRSGAYDYLIKPSEVEELRATVGRAIERRQLRQRLVEMEQLDALKTQFLSMAAHELRTPLTAVSGLLQIARRRIARMSGATEVPQSVRDEAARAGDTLSVADRQTKKLARLIDELVDVARLRQGRVELRLAEVDLSDVVREIGERLRLSGESHEVRVEAATEVRIVADRDRIEQVIENLVGNAIKYSPERGPIDVTLSAGEGHAQISVRDRGIGIAPQELERVFGLFYRSPDPRAETVSGLGLGLYISREMVARHHGTLWAERNPDAGTTFHVRLPLAEVGSPEETRTA